MRRASAALRQAQARQIKLEQFSVEDEGRRLRLWNALHDLVCALESGEGIEAALMAARRRLEE